MNPNDTPVWLEILRNFGIPVLLLLAALWFFNRKLWPYWTEKDKRRDDLMDNTIKELANVIRADSKVTEMVENRLSQLTKSQEDTTRALVEEIRAGRKSR